MEAASTEEATQARARQLWLAVHLPELPLEALPNRTSDAPTVVAEAVRGQWRVVAANRRARALGIAPDLPLGAAFALAHALNVLPRSPVAERATLESLASWICAITPLVSLESASSIVLEVERSLKLFGGLAGVQALVGEELERRRLSFHVCAAPTPLAALWLARHREHDALGADSLAGRLGALPLDVTRWPAGVQALLAEMGVRTLGDCLKLPRDGLARRIGLRCVRDLDRALGKATELRAEWQPPQRFHARIELPAESVQSSMLGRATEALVEQLAPLLRRRQAQVQSLRLMFEHLHREPTVAELDFASPCHERDRLLDLVNDRIERLTLPAPAIAVALETGVFHPLHSESPPLFGAHRDALPETALIERLREHFGAAGVYGIDAEPDHRPERAWKKSAVPEHRSRSDERSVERAVVTAERPLWMLPEPLPLGSPDAHAHYRGRVRLLAGPERIESGWWDCGSVGRDYYTAVAERGERLWVFHDRHGGGWYLHGLFG